MTLIVCSDSMKTKKKKKPHTRKKTMCKEKIDRQTEHMRGELREEHVEL